MRIACLSEAPIHIAEVARAHVQAFGALLPDWRVEDAEAELRGHQGEDAIPTSWIALDGAEWLGTVSLLHDDHEQIRGYSPWLASLYVRPAARGAGIGAALVAHCVRAAARIGVPRLHLYCLPERVGYYQSLGWRRLAELPLGPLQVTVMHLDPEQA